MPRRRVSLDRVSKSQTSVAFPKLLAIAGRLKFPPHRIAHLLDEKGRHELELPAGFPFAVSLFHLRAGAVTQRLTWHQRLELLIPLDGPLCERMGDRVVELQPGDVLVVDHLKPHQAMDVPGLDTRALVISFLPECVFTAGGPPTDYAYLIPFHRTIADGPQVLRAGSEHAEDAHEALARLLISHFDKSNPHREAGCKAWLLVLLNTLIHEFRGSALQRSDVLHRQQQSDQLRPVFEHVREHYSSPVSLEAAARMCGLSKARFGRVFKKLSGMTLGTYLNQVRMAHAVELLEETQDSITEIAFQLGFSDQSHFDRRFRRTFWRTPSHHRAGFAQKR